jgi:uncharacterized protein
MKLRTSYVRFFLASFVAGLTLSQLVAQETTNLATDVSAVNLAVVAVPSSSYVSGDTTVTALNDGVNPRNSRDTRRGTYGNWNRTGTQSVQYEWSQPISTRQVDVYWWIDGAGVGWRAEIVPAALLEWH